MLASPYPARPEPPRRPAAGLCEKVEARPVSWDDGGQIGKFDL
jgi:hypothetical protein